MAVPSEEMLKVWISVPPPASNDPVPLFIEIVFETVAVPPKAPMTTPQFSML